MMQLVIYGAKGYALGVYEALRTLYPKREISLFLVSSMEDNVSVLGGIPVRDIATFADEMPEEEEKRNIQVLIATPEDVQPEIEELLENFGFHNHRRLDSKRWDELMKLFHARLNQFRPLSALPVGCSKPFLRIYMAKSHKDRPLAQNISLPEYVFPLQVGAENTGLRVAGLADNRGDNNSVKNGNYSELTGLYWIWKNKLVVGGTTDSDKKQYYGLAQYRRMMEFSEDDLFRLVDNDVDVVLPYPMPYEPNIHVHHKRYLKESDWEAMLLAIRELQPEYAAAFDDVLEQRYLYNYNVVLARKTVLKKYCEWLFPILERTEELSDPKGCYRQDRYIGYIGETLETLYFRKNIDKLNIVHTGCKLYV